MGLLLEKPIHFPAWKNQVSLMERDWTIFEVNDKLVRQIRCSIFGCEVAGLVHDAGVIGSKDFWP
jgi:hypothetical protein